MDSSPVISIVVPLYNKAAYVRDCLDSLLAQTVGDALEVIVVDDCSTDNGVALVEEYVQTDGRVQLIRLPANAGPAAAQNAGLDAARGDFVGIVGADDWVDPEMYEMLLNLLQKTPDTACARCGQMIETASEAIERSYAPVDGAIAFGAGLYQQMFGQIERSLLSAANALYRKSVLDELSLRFDEELRNMEDVLFNACLFATDAKVIFSAQPFYHIREVAGSLSRAPKALRESYHILVRRIKKLEQTNAVARKYRRSFWVYRTVILATIARGWLHSSP